MQKILLLVLIGFSSLAYSQNFNISGRVTGSKDEPLLGVSVYDLVHGKGATTNEEGIFVIEDVAPGKITLRFSYTGFVTTEQAYTVGESDLSTIAVSLKEDALSLTEVVVTGVTNPVSKLSSSVSISTLKTEDIQKSAPRTTAEIFRSIPGIKAEASGGDGNTNISVRGIPISAGGSKYLQLQEDGLPVLQFGDMAFATSDIFLRADQTLGRIEAIRGGSASTMATNSPAGIINFISKTGAVEGGSIGISSGIDYGNYRADFNYGAPIADGLSFNIGGFYRLGEGPRTAGITANNGGQLKFNLTKQFNNGYARVYFKFLNDRSAAYFPMPVEVTGTNASPTYTSLATFDAHYGTLQSPFLSQDYSTGSNNELRRVDVADGMHPVSKTVGTEFSFDLGSNWKVEDRARFAINSGRFIGPFPASAGSTDAILGAVAGATGWDLTGAGLSHANNGGAYTGSNAMIVHMFDVELNNFNNFVNDMKLKKSFTNGEITLGFYKSYQNVGMSWLWNSYLTDVNGDGLRPLEISDAAGTVMNPGGQFAYGTPLWGNLRRNYDTKYNISAPYAAISYTVADKLSLDGSVRWDIGQVRGSYTGGTSSARDMNGDGVISPNEQKVETIDYSATKPVNYNYDYGSFSFGANYKLDASKAIFGRYSKGAVTKADRILFTDNVLSDGTARGMTDWIDQAEIGFKSNFNNFGLFVTGFYAKVNEQGGFEATTQKVIENHYRSFGLEIEGAWRVIAGLNIKGSLTYTHASITDGDNEGNRPRRQAPLIYTLSPSYTYKQFSVGLYAIGTSASYTQDDNKLKMPAYLIINPYVSYNFSQRFTLSLNANNITNSLGFTESEEGSITENTSNIIRARSITGRTISGSVLFNF